ncbi:MAG: potassium channel protein [Planctomycetes bacterium]|nr:potassium channel protein [Planctomycetota bacterium]
MKSILRIVLLLTTLTLVGTVGFYFVEGDYTLLDALYMTIITLTTVGYREVHEPSGAGKVFVIVFLSLGLGVFLYSLVNLGEVIAGAQMRSWLERRKMDSALKSLRNHFIICGLSRVGLMVCDRLADKGLPFVVIDKDDDKLNECRVRDWHWVFGDATDDRVLYAAGIQYAKGLAAALPSDADNLFVVFSARMLSKDLRILARATDARQILKLERAGANRVVSPFAEGASKMTQLLTNPQVNDFLEIVSSKGSELDLVEVAVAETSSYAGKLLRDTDFSQRGIVIVGIRKPGGELILPPKGNSSIDPGDSLLALGKGTTIQELCAES